MEINTQIGNTYGNLVIKEKEGNYLMCMQDCMDDIWEEIPKYLYDALYRYATDTPEREECPSCDGTGKVEYGDMIVDCSQCDSSGWV